ncbi:MAG: CcmD family protein [Saprospiraceae bacterium]|jgi:hypothetical protein|nr:CcmD family protein [Saprospiraceae bacterium]
MNYKKFLLIIAALWIPVLLKAASQDTDFLRSTGKIYSVVIVICILFLGIIIFLFRLDRKLTKLENQINNEQ